MTDASRPEPIKDLVDFYTRWPEFRPRMQDAANGAPLSHDDLETLKWLIRVADMIGPSDLGRK